MTPKDTDFDLVVLGAGSGGLAAAKRAASFGVKVAICEDDRVGGTCVIRGCVPKKLMVYASGLGISRQIAADFGWAEAPDDFDWAHLCQVRDQVVNNLELAHRRYLAQSQVEVFEGRARVLDPHTVEVAGKSWRTRHILVATGHPTSPEMPEFEGNQHCIDSDAFFKLKAMPKQAILVGGGYIAVEFAGVLQGLGCATTLVVRSRVLREFDQDLATGMTDALRRMGVTVLEQTQVRGIRSEADGRLAMDVEQRRGAQTLHADACVLVATGRIPNTAGLGLEQAGVRLGTRGAVEVDAHHQTAVPSIHAIGDVIDRMNLTPCAIKAGRTFSDRTFGNKSVVMSYDNVPTSVFGHPPIGTVGLTEEEAKRRLHGQVLIYKTRYIPLSYSATPTERKSASIMKIVVDAATDRVLGMHMLGDDAPEIIQGFAAALQAGITKAQLDTTIAVHPTQAEEFVLMR